MVFLFNLKYIIEKLLIITGYLYIICINIVCLYVTISCYREGFKKEVKFEQVLKVIFEYIESPKKGYLTLAHLRKGAAVEMSRARRLACCCGFGG